MRTEAENKFSLGAPKSQLNITTLSHYLLYTNSVYSR